LHETGWRDITITGTEVRSDEALRCYREVVRRFGEAPEETVRAVVAKAKELMEGS
jgi:hypothetical protein